MQTSSNEQIGVSGRILPESYTTQGSLLSKNVRSGTHLRQIIESEDKGIS
jgi:hypothetical protein